MGAPVGLVTGSKPFAGLPTNPAELVLPFIEGLVFDGIRIVTRATPVSYRDLPTLLPDLIDEVQPVFVLALGLALGAPLVRVEKIGLNAAHFGIPDNHGERPLGGVPIDPHGPAARFATWDAEEVVASIVEAGIPATQSFHAGTHLCNLTLYTELRALEARRSPAPCGFLHLPYLPEQIVWLMREQGGRPRSAATASFDLPSMSLETDVKAVKAALAVMARQASRASPSTLVSAEEVL